jgi:hypothetical protein
MRRLGVLALLATSALALSGCATMNVSSHVERGVDFAQYHTYDWGPADALPTGDPRLDNNPFFKDHFEGAVEKQLATRHFERSETGTPDLLIHYHTNISRRFDVNGVDSQRGYCYDNCEPRVIEFEEGTLVIDVVDAHTNKVVWRGWAQDSMEGVINDQDRMERQIDEAVIKMMARFPRHL